MGFGRGVRECILVWELNGEKWDQEGVGGCLCQVLAGEKERLSTPLLLVSKSGEGETYIFID